jgi:hypothetical protein
MGSGQRAAVMASLQDGLPMVRHTDAVASRQPADHRVDATPGALDQGWMAAALLHRKARHGTQHRPPGQRPDAPGPWHRGPQAITAPAHPTHCHTMRVGGAHRSTIEPLRWSTIAVSTRDGGLKTPNDATRHDPDYAQPQQQLTGSQGQPDGTMQDAMLASNMGLWAERRHPAAAVTVHCPGERIASVMGT